MKRSSTAVWLGVLAVLAVVVFAATWLSWEQGWRWVADLDAAALDASRRLGVEHDAWVTFWDVWCDVFSPVTFRVLTLGLIVYEIVRRRRRVALFLFLTVELSGLVTQVAKWLADRPRPATAMVDALSSSFPSGHALGSMVAVLALAVVLLPRVQRRRRPWLVALGAVIVVSVAVGRVALNVHHPSDVLAGWALGYLYFLVCLPVLVTRRAEIPEARDTAR